MTPSATRHSRRATGPGSPNAISTWPWSRIASASRCLPRSRRTTFASSAKRFRPEAATDAWTAAPGAASRRTAWSSRSAPVSPAPRSPAHAEDSHDDQKERCSYEGDDHLADDRAAGDRDMDLEELGQDAAQEGTQDAGHQITEEAKVAAEGNPAGQRAGDQADQDPDDHLVDGQADCHRGRSVKHRGFGIKPP